MAPRSPAPIFTAGNIAGQVQQAEAGTEAALQNYLQTIQKAFADVENSLNSRQKLGEQSQAEERRVKAYKEYARLARLKYNGGYTSYLEVLYSETQLFPAELSAVQAKSKHSHRRFQRLQGHGRRLASGG